MKRTNEEILLLGLVFTSVICLLFSILILIRIYLKNSEDFFPKMMKSSGTILLLIFVVTISIWGILSLQNIDKRIFVVSAAEFKRMEQKEIENLQSQKTVEGVNKASKNLVILDIRPETETFSGQISGSLSLPISRFHAGDKMVVPPRKVAIYSSQAKLEDSLEVAKEMDRQNLPKIYVVKDGYEGLVKTGFKLKENPGFEKE